jgi:hypothetical protein
VYHSAAAGFFFDDVSLRVWKHANPDVVLASYSTSFEPTEFHAEPTDVVFTLPTGSDVDPDGDLVSYAIAGVFVGPTEYPNNFELQGRDGRTVVARRGFEGLNFETVPHYNITIVATDSGSEPPRQSTVLLMVHVVNVNERVNFTSSAAAFVSENEAVNTVRGFVPWRCASSVSLVLCCVLP